MRQSVFRRPCEGKRYKFFWTLYTPEIQKRAPAFALVSLPSLFRLYPFRLWRISQLFLLDRAPVDITWSYYWRNRLWRRVIAERFGPWRRTVMKMLGVGCHRSFSLCTYSAASQFTYYFSYSGAASDMASKLQFSFLNRFIHVENDFFFFLKNERDVQNESYWGKITIFSGHFPMDVIKCAHIHVVRIKIRK